MKNISDYLITSREENAYLHIYLLESFSILFAVVLIIFSESLQLNNLAFTLLAIIYCTGVGLFHDKLSPYKPEKTTQTVVNVLLVLMNLKLFIAFLALISTTPVQSTIVIVVTPFISYKVRQPLGALVFVLSAFVLETFPQVSIKKMIQKELFWIGILFLICAIGLNSSYEKIFFFIGIIPISCIGLLSWRNNSIILALSKMCVFSVVLTLSLPVFLYYIGISLVWMSSLIVSLIILIAIDTKACPLNWISNS